MRPFPRMQARYLVPPLLALLAGCRTMDPPAPQGADTGAGKELNPDSLVEYFDGRESVLGPYEIRDGYVIVEGDINLGPVEILSRGGSPLSKGAANIEIDAKSGLKSWHGIIPYTVEVGGFHLPKVEAAIREWNKAAAVIWVPKTQNHADYVAFTLNTTSASDSPIGKVGGRQQLRLDPDDNVVFKSTVLHEMGHAAGLLHEHQRADRGSYIAVSGTTAALGHKSFTVKGTPYSSYDINSVMHYAMGTYKYMRTSSGALIQHNEGSEWVKLDTLPGKPKFFGGMTLSPGDLAALNYLSKENMPWHAASLNMINNTAATDFVRPFSSGSFRYVLEYAKSTGAFRIYSHDPGSGLVSPKTSGTWEKNWTMVEYFVSNGATFAVFYDSVTGALRIHAVGTDGKRGNLVHSATWGTGLDALRFYRNPGSTKTYLARYDAESGVLQLMSMNADGTPGGGSSPPTYTRTGYTAMTMVENNQGKLTDANGAVTWLPRTYMVFHNRSTNSFRAEEIDASGVGLGKVKTANLGKGYTDLTGYTVNGRGQIFLFNRPTGDLAVMDMRPAYTGTASSPVFSDAGLNYVRTGGGSGFINWEMRPALYSPFGSTEAMKVWIYKASTTQLYSYDLFPFATLK